MKPSVLFLTAAAVLAVAGQAQACRYSMPLTLIHDRWFENADRIVLGRVTSIEPLQRTGEVYEWIPPVVEVERTRVLRGGSSPDLISVRAEGFAASCQPTINNEISGLAVGDEVVVMLDETASAFGLMKASSDITQSYLTRLTPPAE
ncbi:hypothetical protein [Brevundimonas sp.]|uniref:hypothetical protein n=1 Tax=Brevundimonas sp. TaxID=1871086 RepID=UPI003D11AE1A